MQVKNPAQKKPLKTRIVFKGLIFLVGLQEHP